MLHQQLRWKAKKKKAKKKASFQGARRPASPFSLQEINERAGFNVIKKSNCLIDLGEQFISEKAEEVRSSDKSKWLSATVWFRRLLALSSGEASIVSVLDSDVLPFFILFLTEENQPKLQVEAAKVIKYIAFETTRVTTTTFVPVQRPVKNIEAHNALRDLLHSKDDRVLRHACSSLAILSGCVNVKVQQLLREYGLYNRFIQLIRDHPTLTNAALRTLGNIIEGDQNLIDYVIRVDVLDDLRSCLGHGHVDVRKEACWVISYITAGNVQSIQAVLDADLIGPLVKLIETDSFAVMEAAVWAVTKAASGATHGQIRLLISTGCIRPLCYLFCCKNSDIFNTCLVWLEAILKGGDAEKGNETDANPYMKQIESVGGWKVLLSSVKYYEKKLFKKALNILMKYGPARSSYESYLARTSSDEDETDD